MMIRFSVSKSPEDFEFGRVLFKEYARELGIDLSFQNFEKELEEIEEEYAPPGGILFLAFAEEEKPVACFGIRRWDGNICELKRMYVRKAFRGKGLGKLLLEKSVDHGRSLGYKKMRLDTLPSMLAAIEMYKSLGFVEIEAYRFNPIAGTKYFEKELFRAKNQDDS